MKFTHFYYNNRVNIHSYCNFEFYFLIILFSKVKSILSLSLSSPYYFSLLSFSISLSFLSSCSSNRLTTTSENSDDVDSSLCVNPIIVPNQAYWWIRLLGLLQIKMWKVFRQVDEHNGLIYVMGWIWLWRRIERDLNLERNKRMVVEEGKERVLGLEGKKWLVVEDFCMGLDGWID